LHRERHLAADKSADEIHVAAVVINPGLSPLAERRDVYGDTLPLQRWDVWVVLASGEALLNHLAVEDATNAVGAIATLPGEIPLAEPEIELARLGWEALALILGLCGCCDALILWCDLHRCSPVLSQQKLYSRMRRREYLE